MAYLPEVAAVLKLAFDHEGWTFGFDAGTGTLDAGFDLDCRLEQTPLYIHILEDVVLCHAYAPLKVPEEDRRRVMEFVTRANCGLKLCNFEMDLDTGVVCFKTTLCLTGSPLPVRGAMTELVRGALSVLEDYGDALDDVVKAGKPRRRPSGPPSGIDRAGLRFALRARMRQRDGMLFAAVPLSSAPSDPFSRPSAEAPRLGRQEAELHLGIEFAPRRHEERSEHAAQPHGGEFGRNHLQGRRDRRVGLGQNRERGG